MKYFLLIITLLLPLAVQGEEQIHSQGQVAIWYPDDWKVQNDESIFLAIQPQGDMLLFYYMLEAENLETGVSEVESVIRKYVSDITPKGETDDIVINNMPGIFLESAGTIGETPMDMAVLLLTTPNNKIMMVTAILKSYKVAEYKETLEKIFNGIQPLVPVELQ